MSKANPNVKKEQGCAGDIGIRKLTSIYDKYISGLLRRFAPHNDGAEAIQA